MEIRKFLLISVILVFIILIISIFIIFVLPKKEGLGGEQPDPVSVQCASLCETNQRDGFCNFRIRVSDQIRTTCDDLSTNPAYSSYNVQNCSLISCTLPVEEAARLNNQTCTGIGGTWQTPETDGTCPQTGLELVRKLVPTDEPLTPGQICCG